MNLTKREIKRLEEQNPAEIEKLLHEFIRMGPKGATMEDARKIVEEICSRLGLEFYQALGVVVEVGRMKPADREAMRQDIERVQQRAEQLGMTIHEYLEKVKGIQLPKRPIIN